MISSTSTSAFFEGAINQMSAIRAEADKLQQQISSGDKLQNSADDPVAASRLRQLTRAQALTNVDSTAANRAAGDLKLADQSIQNFADAITRIQSLATQAASSTLSNPQRASIGGEITQIYSELFQLANSKDSAGHALFGGQTGGTAYSTDAAGNPVYSGTAVSTTVALGEGQSVESSLTGPEFLNFTVNGNPTNLLQAVKDLGVALAGGSANPQAAAQGSLDMLNAALDSVTTAQTVIGARQAFVELTNERRTTLTDLRTTEQSDVGGTDIATTIANLQQTLLVLQASQSSFSRLSSLSLFQQLN